MIPFHLSPVLLSPCAKSTSPSLPLFEYCANFWEVEDLQNCKVGFFMLGSQVGGTCWLHTISKSSAYSSHWVQNRLIINLWQQCIEGDREFKTKGLIGGGRWGYQCYQNYHLIEG